MLCLFISSLVAKVIVKPQYLQVLTRSSCVTLNGAPQLVQFVGGGCAGF